MTILRVAKNKLAWLSHLSALKVYFDPLLAVAGNRMQHLTRLKVEVVLLCFKYE